MSKRWILADVETTGLNATDRVVEVAWMEINDRFEVLQQGASLIDPGMPIPAGASAIHGITNKDVAGCPSIDEYMATTNLNYGEMVFVAHNSAFDFKFLGRFLPEDTRQLCTVRLARKLWPDTDNHKLATLVYALELDVEKERFHSADGDMAVLLALLGKAYEDFGHTLDEMLEISERIEPITKMPFGKHAGTPLKEVPRSYVSWLLKQDIERDLRNALEAL